MGGGAMLMCTVPRGSDEGAGGKGPSRVVPAYARRVERERGGVSGRGGGHRG